MWSAALFDVAQAELAPEIKTPEQAVSRVVEAYTHDADLRGRFPSWVVERVDGARTKAHKLSDEKLKELKINFDVFAIFKIPDAIAKAQNVWVVRLQHSEIRWQHLSVFVDAQTRSVILIRSPPAPYF